MKVFSSFKAEYSSVNNSTAAYFEDGLDMIIFENGTETHFTHNITGPNYLYENDTIYHLSNLTEVFED